MIHLKIWRLMNFFHGRDGTYLVNMVTWLCSQEKREVKAGAEDPADPDPVVVADPNPVAAASQKVL